MYFYQTFLARVQTGFHVITTTYAACCCTVDGKKYWRFRVAVFTYRYACVYDVFLQTIFRTLQSYCTIIVQNKKKLYSSYV